MENIKIFISYSHSDKELAHKFYDYLSKRDFEVIWDENTILMGDDFDKKLKHAMYEADIYLPIISEHFEKSSFTRSELLLAIGYNSGRNSPRIFPYIVYGNKIPYDISNILCFMGTENILDDLDKLGVHLEKLRGSIFAEKDTNNEIANNLTISLDEYLRDVFIKLEKNEKKNKTHAYLSYIISAIFLLSVLPFVFFRTDNFAYSESELFRSVLYAIQNFAVLAVLAALSRLAFILGKSFMVEAIRNGDRIHAISFGKFYIQAYGNKATRQEIREVLGEWNIDKGSSFHTQDSKEIDPNFYGAVELIKSYFNRK